MISVDISNIWCSVSLPDLLASEKTIFDAHMVLGGGEQKKNNPWLSWLDGSDEARRTWVNPVVAVPIHCGMFDEIDMNEFDFDKKVVPKIYEEVVLV